MPGLMFFNTEIVVTEVKPTDTVTSGEIQNLELFNIMNSFENIISSANPDEPCSSGSNNAVNLDPLDSNQEHLLNLFSKRPGTLNKLSSIGQGKVTSLFKRRSLDETSDINVHSVRSAPSVLPACDLPTVHQGIAVSALPTPFKTIFQHWKEVPKLERYSPNQLQVVYHRRSGEVETSTPLRLPTVKERSLSKLDDEKHSKKVEANRSIFANKKRDRVNTESLFSDSVGFEKNQGSKAEISPTTVGQLLENSTEREDISRRKVSLSAKNVASSSRDLSVFSVTASQTARTQQIEKSVQTSADFILSINPNVADCKLTLKSMHGKSIEVQTEKEPPQRLTGDTVENNVQICSLNTINCNVIGKACQTEKCDASNVEKGSQTSQILQTDQAVQASQSRPRTKIVQTDPPLLSNISVQSENATEHSSIQTDGSTCDDFGPSRPKPINNQHVNSQPTLDQLDSDGTDQVSQCPNCQTMPDNVVTLEKKVENLVKTLELTENNLRVIDRQKREFYVAYKEAEKQASDHSNCTGTQLAQQYFVETHAAHRASDLMTKQIDNLKLELRACKIQAAFNEKQLRQQITDMQTQMNSFQRGMSRIRTAIDRPIDSSESTSETTLDIEGVLNKAEEIINLHPQTENKLQNISKQLNTMESTILTLNEDKIQSESIEIKPPTLAESDFEVSATAALHFRSLSSY